jgi:hypothetical protein
MRSIPWLAVYFLSLAVTVMSCVSSHNFHDCEKNILGKWAASETTIHCDTLFFLLDNKAVFTSRGDTIFRYQFSIDCRSSKLFLKDHEGNQFEQEISLLTNDRLLFANFFNVGRAKNYVKLSAH